MTTSTLREPVEYLLRSLGIDVRESAGRLKARCPLHQENTASFTVYGDGHFYCFGCHRHGDLRDLIDGLDQADRLASDPVLIDGLVRLATQPREKHVPPMFPHVLTQKEQDTMRGVIAFYRSCLNQEAQSYLFARGVEPRQVRSFGIGWCSGTDPLPDSLDTETLCDLGVLSENLKQRFERRVILPGKSQQYFSGRTVGNSSSKYLNTSTPKALFALGSFHSRNDPVFLVEGFFDALAIEALGYNAVAVGGTGLRPDQRTMFQGCRLVLCFDGDIPGQEAQSRVKSFVLSAAHSIHSVVLPDGRDPAWYAQEKQLWNLEQIILAALPTA